MVVIILWTVCQGNMQPWAWSAPGKMSWIWCLSRRGGPTYYQRLRIASLASDFSLQEGQGRTYWRETFSWSREGCGSQHFTKGKVYVHNWAPRWPLKVVEWKGRQQSGCTDRKMHHMAECSFLLGGRGGLWPKHFFTHVCTWLTHQISVRDSSGRSVHRMHT